MKVFLITDIHYGEDSNYPNHKGEGYINVFGGKFKEFLPFLKDEMNKCDLVMNLGDLIHDVAAEEDLRLYREAMALLSTETPIRHVPGNHDVRNISKSSWASLIGEEKSYYSFDMGNYHHIVLDGNMTEPRGAYTVDEEQLNWLEEDLARVNNKVLVYTHHPLDNQSMENNYYFSERPERGSINNKFFIRKILEKSGKVLAVFSGHTHFFNKQEINGISYFTIPSFAENDGEHNPAAEYALADVGEGKINIEIKKAHI